ncbi:hypothetical protein Patl1_14065 [Pistacia atlantica]|uniref:Uncharacterized protein n=1 Tax=Pistacia atlantica TaxID=434234 RepID=A0ACC1AXQ3_9ROSI|nr:hypothetical protein Patl1_14065 [Pistacia atlantica]
MWSIKSKIKGIIYLNHYLCLIFFWRRHLTWLYITFADDESADLDNLFKRTMPWLGDEFSMKDSQALPGFSLVQWMNMQQNPSLANSMQSNYMHSLPGSVLQNLAGADLSRQLGLPPQIPQPNNLQFNSQRSPQQVQQIDQPPKLPSTMNQLSSIIPPPQLLGDITQQSRQNMITQTLSPGQVQVQMLQPHNLVQNNNILPQQPSMQNPPLPINIPPNMQQQQHVMGQNQQQNLMQSQLPDQANQHLHMSDKQQIQLQLLQRLQQQQQSLLAQQSTLQQPAQLQVSQSFSRSVTATQMLDMPQTTPTSLPQANVTSQQITKGNNMKNVRFSYPPQQPRLQQQQTGLLPEMAGHVAPLPAQISNQHSTAGGSVLTGAVGAGHSVITDDVPSCSTSPSANNSQNLIQPMANSRPNRSMAMGEDMAQSASTLLSTSGLETIAPGINLAKDFQPKTDVKPSLNISKNQNQCFFAAQTYLHGTASQADYLDTSSSTSVCLSQNDVHIQQNNSLSYNPLRDTSQDGEVQADPRSNVPYGSNIDGPLVLPNHDPLLTKSMGVGKDFSNNLSSGGMLANYENSKDVQQELSSSIVSQSFGVPDMTFNPIDSTINDSSFMNRARWAPPPQFPPRMRSYTKVYKRGAVGRSIDITHYSGYDELKQDLARRFGIEGQLEDRQRIGWKLVYVDHEHDVLLVGDDPWEEFVRCVRCIKILSPQEVQQMSLDGDFGNSVLPHQACSSSDNGNV